MKVFYSIALLLLSTGILSAQAELTSWLINSSGITGKHYVQGNSTPINDTAKANVQVVRYSAENVYINSSGIPSYIVGPYLDGNPSLATNNKWLFKIPRNPVKNTGSLTSTPLGPIGVLINGVPIYDYKDAASYSNSTGEDVRQGGDGVWNRNAILAEMDGFDCAKGHPSPIFSGGGPGQGTLEGGSYHHHQNPTAFNLDLKEVSDVCDLYLADGLYTINDKSHSPLIGFAFDGHPIYGAYGYEDPNDPTSSIVRIESSYQLRKITKRNTLADGSSVTAGPDVSNDFPLGWYREDFEFVENSGHLDEHNGRWCKTPEYPNGIYAYFATVDENWNSAYPYFVGPTYYGVVEDDNFVGMGGGNSVQINETVQRYLPTGLKTDGNVVAVNVFPNPSSEFIAIQIVGILHEDLNAVLYDVHGKEVTRSIIAQGSTIWHLDIRTLYNGEYILHLFNEQNSRKELVLIQR